MQFSETAIVILSWNGKSFLEKFLPTVVKNSGNCRIIVADNGSTDDSVAFLQENFPAVEIIQNKTNTGFAGGYNEALKHVTAEYFILLNSDIETPAGWTAPLVDFMKKNPGVAACQPKILDYNSKNKFEYAGACGGFMDKYGYPFCRGRIFNVLEEDKGQYNEPAEVFWATGACMMIRSEIFLKVGGFDQDYFAHMEEIDLCWRIKNLGHKIFVIPGSHIFHVGGGTLNKINPRKTFLNFRNNLITYTKNHSGSLLFFILVFRIKLDAIAALKFLLEGNFTHAFAVVKAHWAYLFSIKKTLQKRSAYKKLPGYAPARSGVYNGNIVYLHFIKKIKTFAELAAEKFFH